MTNIEYKIFEKRRRNFLLANLANRILIILNEELEEEYGNWYYADSWEQSGQISGTMHELQGKIDFLNNLRRKFYYDFKITLSECTRFIVICFNYFNIRHMSNIGKLYA